MFDKLQSNPPVCKIMDYGKYRFEQAKREKEARKNQRVVDIKEVRLSLNIDTHDFNTKLNKNNKCGQKHSVRITILKNFGIDPCRRHPTGERNSN